METNWQEAARREALRLRSLHRALAPSLLVGAAGAAIVGVATFPGGDELPPHSIVLLAAVVFLAFGVVLTWVAGRKDVVQIRALDSVIAFLASSPAFVPTLTRLKTALAFHLVVEGSVEVDGANVPATVDLIPSTGDIPTGEAVDVFARPAYVAMRTPWRRPDNLLVSLSYFYAEFAAFHALEAYSFREDLWKSPWEGVHTDWVFKRLEARVVLDPKEAPQENARRLALAFEAFRETVRLSLAPPGDVAPKFRQEGGNLALPLAFGFSRIAYCTACRHRAGHDKWSELCPKCGRRMVKAIGRSGFGAVDPQKHEQELHAFATRVSRG